MIELINVSKIYRDTGVCALQNINLTIDKGEFVFLIGATGAGKTSLIKLLLREETADRGRVMVDGVDLGQIHRRRIPQLRRGIGVATFSSQNLGAGRRSRIWQSVKAALAIYFVWWVFVMAFTFLLGGAAIRGITGSTDEVIISNALLYLKISAPVIPPMAVLVILRNMLQGIRHTVEPLLASGLELVGKVIFAVWLVPVRGYRAVCFCEPTTWVVCFVFILLAVWRCRGDLRDAEKI